MSSTEKKIYNEAVYYLEQIPDNKDTDELITKCNARMTRKTLHPKEIKKRTSAKGMILI